MLPDFLAKPAKKGDVWDITCKKLWMTYHTPLFKPGRIRRKVIPFFQLWGMVISGIQIDDHQPFPFFNPIHIVEVQYFDRDPTFGSGGGDGGSFQPEVVSPFLLAWIVEGDQLSTFRIIRADIVSFVAITTGTGQG